MFCKKLYKIKGFEHDVCDAFIRKVMQQAHTYLYYKLCVKCEVTNMLFGSLTSTPTQLDKDKST